MDEETNTDATARPAFSDRLVALQTSAFKIATFQMTTAV